MKIVWIGFPKGSWHTAQAFLNAAKIPYVKILERAAVVQFPELTQEQLGILETNNWIVAKPGIKKIR